MGNPLNWSSADKCLLVTAAVMPFTLWNYLILRWASRHPEAAPYFDQVVLAQVARLHALGWFGAWCLIAVVALSVRRRHPHSRLLVATTVQVYCLGASFFSWTMGSFTAPYVAAMALLGFAVGMIFFDRRQVLHGVATFMGVIAVGTVADQLGVVPYAPALREAPFTGGRLHPSWLAGMGVFGFTITLFGLALIYFIVLQWRDREEKLAAASEQLGRVNDLVSRFIAAQVAEEIRAGNFSSVERHDRRRLTIMFSDIRGFSDTADRIEPEELSELLGEYFDLMMGIAESYEATVDKFIGDGMMVFFGAPLGPHEPDHAVRAVRMAMAMQARMDDLRARWRARGIEEPFDIRIGINTGVANVGAFGARGRMDYTAIGRQVNLAARLQVASAPGRILLSHATWALVKDAVHCVPKGEIEVKGFHAPVRVYEVDESLSPDAVVETMVRETA